MLLYMCYRIQEAMSGRYYAAALSTQGYIRKRPVLFIDVGTNVEITLAARTDHGRSRCCRSCAGRGIAGIGAKAKPGTDLRGEDRSQRTKKLHIDAIAGEDLQDMRLRMIELISELYLSNIIDHRKVH